MKECQSLGGCETGQAKITQGYNLPAEWVIHTVGPVYSGEAKDKELLADCYRNSLDLAKTYNIHSIAFPAISTGVYGYPLKEATAVAMSTVKQWLNDNRDYFMEVIFCCFNKQAYDIYQSYAAENNIWEEQPMLRTITVKGMGRATAKPDTVVISMSLDSRAIDYDKAMEIASYNIQDITKALSDAGFEKDDVKTTNFNVRTDYKSMKDRNGNYYREFQGYVVSHNLKLEFGFHVKLLSQALSAIAGCKSHPQISISFVVKEVETVNEEMLRSATDNARSKAAILCDAAGVSLGKLLTIDYNWGELNICSNTKYNIEDDCMAKPMAAGEIEIEPDDIDVSDTATFVWEIN